MGFTLWFVIIGGLLIASVLTRGLARRFAINTTMIYLLVGVLLGPHGAGMITLDPVQGSWFTERLTEVAVIISLFSAGLKLGLPLKHPGWRLPLRLAFVSMTLTVGLIAALGVLVLQLPLGAAVLLGAILAPTDPVLASDVQTRDPTDRDRLRFGLTGEAGLNDGTAFPFVMLGLGLLGLHELGANGWRWFAVDLFWGIGAGLAVGALLGWLIGRIVIGLRARHKEAVGLDEFLALGLVALSYGVALWIHSYGFLAVFAAGVALRRTERSLVGEDAPFGIMHSADLTAEEMATHPRSAPTYLTAAVANFNEQTERIGEFLVVVFVGAMLTAEYFTWKNVAIIATLLLVVRPLAVWLGMVGSPTSVVQRSLIAWFGIRGLGSMYYLSHATQKGLPLYLAEEFAAITLTVIAASIMLHGLSVPFLMNFYGSRAASPPAPDARE